MSYTCGHDGITVWCRECRPNGPMASNPGCYSPFQPVPSLDCYSIPQPDRLERIEARLNALEARHHRSPELALCDVELGRTPEEIDLRAALAKYLGVPEETIDMVSPTNIKLALEVPGMNPMIAHTAFGPVIIKR